MKYTVVCHDASIVLHTFLFEQLVNIKYFIYICFFTYKINIWSLLDVDFSQIIIIIYKSIKNKYDTFRKYCPNFHYLNHFKSLSNDDFANFALQEYPSLLAITLPRLAQEAKVFIAAIFCISDSLGQLATKSIKLRSYWKINI